MEQNFGKGARSINPIHRKARKLFRKKVGRATIFDWNKGYDVRDTIGTIAIKNQGVNNSCGGQSGSYFLEIQRRLRNIHDGAISAKSVYAPIAFIGGGTTIPYLEDQISIRGAELEASISSYNAYGEPLTESMMIEQSWITPAIKQDMMTRAGYTPYDCADDIETVANAIQSYGCAIIEVKGQNNGTWLKPMPLPPVGKNGIWHHFLCVIGAKMVDGKKCIIALNSWGTVQTNGLPIGDNGVQYISEDYFNANGVVDAFCLIPNQYITSLPSTMSRWQILLRFFRMKWGLSYN